jgi:hypothetical protein
MKNDKQDKRANKRGGANRHEANKDLRHRYLERPEKF